MMRRASNRGPRKMKLCCASEPLTKGPALGLMGLFALAAMCVLTQGDAAAQSQKSNATTDRFSAGNAQNGKLLYASHGCEGCHGAEAQGAVGPRLGPSPIPFSNFVASVRQPTSQMPPFSIEAAPEAELTDIYAFLKTVPQASLAENSSGGNAENGKKLFDKYGCYECHGYQGQGSILTGARIAPNPIPLAAMIAYVRKPKGEMPPFSAKLVPDQDLADIRAFLQSLPRPPDAKSIPTLQQ